MNATIHGYTEKHFSAVADVYRDAVEALAGEAYTAEQVQVWAAYAEEREDFGQRLARGGVLVAEVAGEIIAFGQLEPADHIAFLYCRGRCSRRGFASAIYRRMESESRRAGVAVLRTEASRISRPFFEKHGFVLDYVEQSVRAGVLFERFKMSKPLGPSTGTSA